MRLCPRTHASKTCPDGSMARRPTIAFLRLVSKRAPCAQSCATTKSAVTDRIARTSRAASMSGLATTTSAMIAAR